MDKKEKAKAEALRLRAAGTPVEEIVAKTGLDAQEVVDIIAGAGNTLTTLQGIKAEAALISYGVTKRDRLQKIVELRNKVEAELDKRDFSDIPTEKLPVLLLKINEAIREEVTPPRILSSPMPDGWGEKSSRSIENL